MNQIELLSPAKNLDCGIAAINCGADAVYIGVNKFSARKAAGNSLSDVEKLINYAHIYKSKVYVALNTLLFDNEFDDALNLINSVYNIGADALIIQDYGLLECDLPPIALHASTQMDNRDWRKVKFLEEVGFDQVVLARELSLSDIKEIKSKTNVKLEYFVHGALCVCYSGQCYMSSSINNRSANRGECAQPCRLKYDLINGKGDKLIKNKHLLSLKDLNLSDHIEDLINSGVSSLKIEGRLKDIDYVQNITTHYRNAIDQVLEKSTNVKSSIGNSVNNISSDPEKTFSRGFTNYFFNGRNRGVWAVDSPKSLGQKIGKVLKVEKDNFKFLGDINLNNGDGLCFFNRSKELVGTKINKVEGTTIFPQSMLHLYSGATLFRNYDHQFNSILKKDIAARKININLHFSYLEKENLFELKLTDEDGLCSDIRKELDVEKAINATTAFDSIVKQLKKFGNTIFNILDLKIDIGEPVFIKSSDLNLMRREIAELHLECRQKSYKRDEFVFNKTSHDYPLKNIDYRGNVLNSKAHLFYKRHGVDSVDWGYEKEKSKDAELMIAKHCLRYYLNECPAQNQSVTNKDLFLVNNNDRYHLKFDCNKCQMTVLKVLEETKLTR